MKKPLFVLAVAGALCTLIVVAPMALAAPASAPPSAKGADDAARAGLAEPLRIAAGDALPLLSMDFTDTLAAPEYEDLWTVDLAAGQQLIVAMYPPSTDDFDLCLWAPGTTDFSFHSSSVAISWNYSGAESIKYIVPEDASGTYYVDVWTLQASVTDGDYRLTVNKQSPSKTAVRITPPAVPRRAVSGRKYAAYGTLKPLHFAGDQTVKVEWQKYSGGRWRAAGAMRPVNKNYRSYTRYKVAYSFYGYGSGTMRWRVRAIHLADQLHPRKASTWRYFTVRV